MQVRSFALLPEEMESMTTIRALMWSAIAIFSFVLPTIQILLAAFYIKLRHAWSRLIVREVAVFPWDATDEPVTDKDSRTEEPYPTPSTPRG